MPVSLLSIFLTALLVGLGWFLFLSIAVMATIKLAEFRKPSVSRLSRAYLSRYLLGSVLAGFTAVYIFVREGGETQQQAWTAIIFAVLLWSVFVIVLELLAVQAED